MRFRQSLPSALADMYIEAVGQLRKKGFQLLKAHSTISFVVLLVVTLHVYARCDV